MKKSSIKILGAGIAGLTTAICLKNRDPELNVTVYEKNGTVGHSRGDFQQFGNWNGRKDVLEQIAEDTGIDVVPAVIKSFYGMTVFSPEKTKVELKTRKPLLYTIRRGPEDSLDSYLRDLALERGVKILYNCNIPENSVDVVASGPKEIQGLACGYRFQTNLPDGITGIVDDKIALREYAYLVVVDGEATLSTVLLRDFNNARKYRDLAFKRYRECLRDFKTEDMVEFSGFDAYRHLKSRQKDGRLYVGSAGGFQSTLFGFGMRQAMLSGSLAARALYEGEDFDELWRERLDGEHRNEMVLRMLFDQLGNSGYEVITKIFKGTQKIVEYDPLPIMKFAYNSPLVRCLFPIAKGYFERKWPELTKFPS